MGLRPQNGGDDLEGERQSTAEVADALGVLGGIGDPGVLRAGDAQGPVEDLCRARPGQFAQIDVATRYGRQDVPGRDDDSVVRTGRNERQDLTRGRDVVQDDQQRSPVTGQLVCPGLPQCQDVVAVGRDVLLGRAEVPEQERGRVHGPQVGVVPAVAAHIDEERPAGEPAELPGAMGRLDSQRGLPRASHAGHEGDHGGGGRRVLRHEPGEQLV